MFERHNRRLCSQQLSIENNSMALFSGLISARFRELSILSGSLVLRIISFQSRFCPIGVFSLGFSLLAFLDCIFRLDGGANL
jgi:hypothetical protein